MMRPMLLRGHGFRGGGGQGVSGNPQISLKQGTFDKNVKTNVEKRSKPAPKFGVDYNIGGKVPSYEFKYPVKLIRGNSYVHSVPKKGVPFSVFRKFDINGNLYSERFYDQNGRAYLEIDYTDHGTPERHSIPHYHRITYSSDGKFIREENINV